jgi:hypothetical protein
LKRHHFVVVANALLACSHFSSSPPAPTPPDAATLGDAGVTDADVADAAFEANEPSLPATLGNIAHESAPTLGIAVTPTDIYWWSTQDQRIAKVSKASPSVVETHASRPTETVTAVVADANAVFWLEAGPDTDGGVSQRIMTKDALGVRPVYQTDQALKHLALDPTRVVTTSPGGVIIFDRSLNTTASGAFGLDQLALTIDTPHVYYSFGDSIYDYSGPTPQPLIEGLNSPRELAVNGDSLEVLVTTSTGSSVLAVDRAKPSQPGDSGTTVAAMGPGPIHYAIAGAGIVWGNVTDGTVEHVAGIGAVPEPIANGVHGINAIVADSDGVYWTADDGSVTWVRR